MPNKITTILVDDHLDALKVLEALLQSCAPEIEILGKYTSSIQAISEIRSAKPKVVFLDVDMPEMSGFEVMDLLKTMNTLVVFVTGHADSAVTALRKSAFDFLTKPVSQSSILQCVNRIHEKLDSEDFSKAQGKSAIESSKILVNRHDKAYILEPDDIVFIQAFGAYSTIHCLDGMNIDSSKPISYYEDKLSDAHFYRVHRSYLINMNHVKEIEKKDSMGNLILAGGLKIELAKNQLYKLLAMLAGPE